MGASMVQSHVLTVLVQSLIVLCRCGRYGSIPG
ncbi:hypothetical protein A2U01_0008347, partial [Trifolium medium]|nr:hypothetical protein [Trifolium medium]